jgi:PAS domain S-box-containing protein
LAGPFGKAKETNMIQPDRFHPLPSSLSCTQWLELLDELNIGAFNVDLNHRITAINHCAQALINLREHEVLQRDCREIFTGVPCMVECPAGQEDGKTSKGAAVSVKDEDEQQHLITRMAVPVYDHQGKVSGCLTILQDHSPVSDLIEQLRYEQRQLKNILDSLDIGVFTISRGSIITFFNTAAERMTGYNRRHLLGQPCTMLFQKDAADSGGVCDDLTPGRANRSTEVRLISKDGEMIPVRAGYTGLRNEKGRIVGGLITFQDLTLVHRLNQVIKRQYTCFDMIGKSPVMEKIFAMIPVVAASDATVLIEGATGTGKDLLAKVIHAQSARSAKPWVKINCAAIPDSLIESEIFGYVKGAFTGADRDKPGRFQEAAGGTIFLDEIGDLPMSLQAKLLRVLEDKEFYPLGSRRTQKVDVRIISATNRRLEHLVRERQFREDLFYRLNVVRIELPPLSQRPDDLPLMIHHCLRKLCASRGLPPPAISPSAMKILLNREYPGNVRELENILEHALILCRDDPIEVHHLPDYVQRKEEIFPGSTAPLSYQRFDDSTPEVRRILQALAAHDGHRGKAAKALNMDRTTLWRKMRRFGLLK